MRVSLGGGVLPRTRRGLGELRNGLNPTAVPRPNPSSTLARRLMLVEARALLAC